MRLSSMFFALLFAPLALAAQVPNRNGPVYIQLHLASCPVGFSVDRRPDGAIVWANDPHQPASHGQGLDISFAKPKTQIASADITVHGYPAGLRIVPATPSAPGEITETFHLTANAGETLLHPSVWTAHMAAIGWVELTRLDYADGSSWQTSAESRCSAAPSLFVLVDSAR